MLVPQAESSAGPLAGGGETGVLMRSFEWSRPPLGPVEGWPQSLRTIVSTCLNSRFPILIWWGPDLVMLYNDAYRDIVGSKHPHALGAPGREVWPEIWPIIGPMLDGVISRGEATWSENTLLRLVRRGFPEECYFTFSYSPIRDESGGIGGVFTAVTETTEQVLNARRLRILRELAAATGGVGDAEDVCQAAAEVLGTDAADGPYALIYLAEGDGARLAASVGIDPAGPLAPARLDPADTTWSAMDVLHVGASKKIDQVPAPGSGSALVLPILAQGENRATGVLVAGLSEYLVLDDPYRGFLGLVAGQIGSAIATARAFEDARRRAESLAELDRAKTAFFSNVSHEFRTPLTLLLGPLEELLRGEVKPGGERGAVALAHRNALRLLRLVNTLLDFSRIEAGRIQAIYVPTDLATVTADLASTFRSSVERAGLRLRVECPPLREPVYVDREMWEKIVLNLLSNAFKFTLEGEIAVSLRVAGRSVELRVEDTGTGIPQHELSRVFERFHRVEGAKGRTQEGTGIGLSLLQELVRLHGGSVRVESAPGKGSAFIVSVPLGTDHLPGDRVGAATTLASTGLGSAPFVEEASRWISDPTADVPPERARAAAGERRERVLVADDNADMRDYLRRLLAERWEVEAVADGAQALAAIRRRRPDVVLSDVMMPGLDGFGLVAALRADHDTASLPIVLLSARAGEEAQAEGRSSGADDYLVKPFSAKELVTRVQSQLLLARLRRTEQIHRDDLRRIFMGAPMVMALLRGPDHVFELANDAYRAVVGDRDLVGKPIAQVLPELSGQGIFELLDHAYRTGESYVGREMPVHLERAGEIRQTYFTFSYQPFRDNEGDIAGIAVVGIDVTEAVQARLDIEKLARQLREADQRKDEFLAMLGHELRNPLAPIQTAVRLMKLRGDAHERERLVIERQVAHLSRLVDDLLDVSRVARGKVRMQRRPTDVGEVISQGIEMASPLLEERNHYLIVEAPRGHLMVDGDPTRLAQVVANLLTNAARYTPPRGRIAVSAAAEGEEVVIRVRDNGVGIASDMLATIFEPFVQGRRVVDRAQGGLGLGLSLVKNLVALHSGSVTASSDGPDKGSEFVVRLPALRQEAAVSGDGAPRPSDVVPRREGRRVLLVDDNEDAAAMLADALQAMGHRVVIAHDGAQALHVLRDFAAEVGILDIGLPVMDGFELARRIKALPGCASLRLIAVTGYGQDDDRARTREAGFEQHLVKPVDLGEILQAVERQ